MMRGMGEHKGDETLMGSRVEKLKTILDKALNINDDEKHHRSSTFLQIWHKLTFKGRPIDDFYDNYIANLHLESIEVIRETDPNKADLLIRLNHLHDLALFVDLNNRFAREKKKFESIKPIDASLTLSLLDQFAEQKTILKNLLDQIGLLKLACVNQVDEEKKSEIKDIINDEKNYPLLEDKIFTFETPDKLSPLWEKSSAQQDNVDKFFSLKKAESEKLNREVKRVIAKYKETENYLKALREFIVANKQELEEIYQSSLYALSVLRQLISVWQTKDLQAMPKNFIGGVVDSQYHPGFQIPGAHLVVSFAAKVAQATNKVTQFLSLRQVPLVGETIDSAVRSVADSSAQWLPNVDRWGIEVTNEINALFKDAQAVKLQKEDIDHYWLGITEKLKKDENLLREFADFDFSINSLNLDDHTLDIENIFNGEFKTIEKCLSQLRPKNLTVQHCAENKRAATELSSTPHSISSSNPLARGNNPEKKAELEFSPPSAATPAIGAAICGAVLLTKGLIIGLALAGLILSNPMGWGIGGGIFLGIAAGLLALGTAWLIKKVYERYSLNSKLETHAPKYRKELYENDQSLEEMGVNMDQRDLMMKLECVIKPCLSKRLGSKPSLKNAWACRILNRGNDEIPIYFAKEPSQHLFFYRPDLGASEITKAEDFQDECFRYLYQKDNR